MAYDVDLAQRVREQLATEPAVTEKAMRPFDMTGRPMKGWILVAPEGVAGERDLAAWVARGVEFARSLPAKG